MRFVRGGEEGEGGERGAREKVLRGRKSGRVRAVR